MPRTLPRSYAGRVFRAALSGAIVVGLVSAAACSHEPSMMTLSVAEVSEMLSNAAESPVVCDANSEAVREKYGTIPGAVLLTSPGRFRAEQELGTDKATPHIFYCSSQMCSAAPMAARRAVAAGYERVYVLSSGIKGWVAAGQPVDRPSAG